MLIILSRLTQYRMSLLGIPSIFIFPLTQIQDDLSTGVMQKCPNPHIGNMMEGDLPASRLVIPPPSSGSLKTFGNHWNLAGGPQETR